MTARAVRLVVFGVCAIGIAGMIVGSVADDNTVALTFGLITAASVACLIVATAVAGAPSGEGGGAGEAAGHRVEELVARLVASGADEAEVRELVREAVGVGRAQPRRQGGQDAKVGAGVHGGRTPRPDGRRFT